MKTLIEIRTQNGSLMSLQSQNICINVKIEVHTTMIVKDEVVKYQFSLSNINQTTNGLVDLLKGLKS